MLLVFWLDVYYCYYCWAIKRLLTLMCELVALPLFPWLVPPLLGSLFLISVLLRSLKNVKLNWSRSWAAVTDGGPSTSLDLLLTGWPPARPPYLLFIICSFLFRNRNSVPGDETPLLWRLCDVFIMWAYLLKKALPWSTIFLIILGRALRFSTRKELFTFPLLKIP